jgi:PAS domain S-box-containing protein
MANGSSRSPWTLANPDSPFRTVMLMCLVAILSYLAARLGGILVTSPHGAWPLWLGNVLLISILLLVPRKIWPLLIAAAFAAVILNDLQTGQPIRSIALLILADTIEVLTSAWCLSHFFKGVPELNSVRALAKFSLFAVILAPCLAAFVVALVTTGNYWTSWSITFFSEAIVSLTLMPAILGWFSKRPPRSQKPRPHSLEAAALIAGLVLLFGYLALAAPGRSLSEVLLYLLVPMMLWSALRFGTTGVSTSVIVIAVLAIWSATHGRGPFVQSGLFNNVLSLQLFLLFAAAPFMVLAAVVEQDKQASEQFFRSVFENAQIGISVFHIDRQTIASNHALQEMLGYTETELGRLERWDSIYHPEERDASAQRYSEIVLGKRDRSEWEQRLIRKDGRIATVRVRFSLLRNAAGRPQYVAALQEDITERKRLQWELVAAKETAEAATRAKSDFLANMSHEIRTPMNAILGMTHLALNTDLTPKQRDYLTKAKSSAQSLLGIISDVLDFSKIEAGKLDMERTDFRLEDVLGNVSNVVSQKAHDKNLEFLIAGLQDLPSDLVGDPLRLGQILINLVNNAVKFTDHGEILVTVAEMERVLDRVNLKFSVRDSGIGMTPAQTARLFQAFNQADSSTTRKFGGTGLGLSISRKLVEMMNGNIWAESDYGKGTTFYFTAWFGTGSGGTRRRLLTPDLAGIRVLVVDDNQQARDILCDSLKGLAFRAHSVSSGEDALLELAAADSQDNYQLVLMDWQMPHMDGLQATRLIKSSKTLNRIPRIVMVTAFGQEGLRAQADELAIDGYLLKPVTPSTLYDLLIGLFGVAGDPASPSPPTSDPTIFPDATGIRILLVEDNQMNQQVATELLESTGATVSIANHGGEAVRLLTEGEQPPPFDIVFMDLQMPEMDGFTATRLLRAQPQLQKLPIIAITAHALVEEQQRCLEAGMNDHVSKPIDPDALFTTLMRWSRPRKVQAAETEAPPPRAAEDKVFPQMEGVDVAGGLRRVAGNKRLYRDLLVRFAAQQGNAGVQIAVALESNDLKLAERLAHTVAGVAGNIGLSQVFTAAQKLERGIRQMDPAVSVLVEEFDRVMSRQVEVIRRAIPDLPSDGSTNGKVGADLDAPVTAAAIARLRLLLESSEADAAEAFLVLEDALAGTVDETRLSALKSAVSEFDFDGALLRLNEVVEDAARERPARPGIMPLVD